MSSRDRQRAAGRPPHRTALAVLVGLVVVAVIGVFGYRSLSGSSASALPANAVRTADRPADRPADRAAGHRPRQLPLLDGSHRIPGDPPGPLKGGRARALGVADGEVPQGATVFDDRYPAVAKLDADLLRELRRAATDAKSAGIAFTVNSGWRSRRYQEQLFRQAVTKYGSTQAAERWVARPGRSVHESGDAVDVGPVAAMAWLSEYGAAYGLCQTYGDEPWHYELRPDAADHGCPREYADPTHDPRLQQ
jgi:D-alanyl-D-alanine carboxypeptidase